MNDNIIAALVGLIISITLSHSRTRTLLLAITGVPLVVYISLAMFDVVDPSPVWRVVTRQLGRFVDTRLWIATMLGLGLGLVSWERPRSTCTCNANACGANR